MRGGADPQERAARRQGDCGWRPGRRAFLGALGAAAFLPFLPRGVGAQEGGGLDECKVAAPTLEPRPQVAVSLRALSRQLEQCQGGDGEGVRFFRSRCARYGNFLGMTRLDGVVVDRANRDIILWGLREERAPRLSFDDFVIALRAASGKYVETRNGQRYRVSPGISLDADGKTFDALDALDVREPGGRARYVQICGSPMVVRVDGMPRHTRLAKLLVDADFRMKLVGFSEVVLPIRDPFLGSSEMHARQDFFFKKAGRPSPVRFTALRMWFEPGAFSYEISTARDTVFLDRAQVVLRDRARATDAQGQLQDHGIDDPFARAFTCAWTMRMEEVYEAEPIWRDMHNIYRHFAIADIIVREGLFDLAGFDPAALLDRHRVEEVRLPDTMPGYAKFFDLKEEGFESTYSVCGGVSVGFDSGNLGRAAAGRKAGQVPARIAAARPDGNTPIWVVR